MGRSSAVLNDLVNLSSGYPMKVFPMKKDSAWANYEMQWGRERKIQVDFFEYYLPVDHDATGSFVFDPENTTIKRKFTPDGFQLGLFHTSCNDYIGAKEENWHDTLFLLPTAAIVDIIEIRPRNR